MQMNTFKILTLSAVGAIILASCSLEEETFTFVSGDDVAAAGNYDQLVSGAYCTLLFPFEWGNYHNMVNFDCDYQTGPTWAFGSIGAGNFYDDGSANNFYKYYYNSIHRANYHYYLVGKIDNIDQKVKNNALGELQFLKAWSYFQLVQYYGPVPLFITSISEGNVPEQPRASVKDVYAEIIRCAEEAESLLYSRNDPAWQKGHPCHASATALLAKVYATIGSASMKSGKITVKGGPGSVTNSDGTTSRLMPVPITHDKDLVAGYEEFDSQEYYALAFKKAEECINSGEFALANSQKELWAHSNQNGPEFEFTLQTVLGQGSLYANYVPKDYLGWADPNDHGTWSSGYYVQRDHWLQLFDDYEDERITWGVMHRIPNWYDSNTGKLYYAFYPERDSVYVNKGINGYDRTDQVASGAHMYGSKLMKFSQVSVYPLDGNRCDYNWPYMRYAETILFYAEADNELNGPTEKAMKMIDLLNKRNNSTLCSERNAREPFTKESFRSYILEERAKELIGEGVRRTDLIRWGIYLQVMNAIGTTDENGVIKRREAKHLLVPLPPNEVNANPFIDKNNPGW